MNNIEKTLMILEGNDDLIFESLLSEGIDEPLWDNFLKELTKLSTKVNDRYASAREFLKAVFEKAKDQFDLATLKTKLARPSVAILNGPLAGFIIDTVNAAGATLSAVAVKNAARAN